MTEWSGLNPRAILSLRTSSSSRNPNYIIGAECFIDGVSFCRSSRKHLRSLVEAFEIASVFDVCSVRQARRCMINEKTDTYLKEERDREESSTGRVINKIKIHYYLKYAPFKVCEELLPRRVIQLLREARHDNDGGGGGPPYQNLHERRSRIRHQQSPLARVQNTQTLD